MITALLAAATVQVGTGLDCDAGFEGLVEQVASRPGVERQSNPPSVPYVTFVDEAEKTVYTFTVEGAVGHPAAVRRMVVKKPDGVHVTTSACGYGTRSAFDRMMAQFRDLNGKARTEISTRAGR